MKKKIVILMALALTMNLAACSQNVSSNSANVTTTANRQTTEAGTTADTEAITYTPGTYVGTGSGNNGEITVSVTVTTNSITSVEVTGHHETAGLSDSALEQIPAGIVQYQSLGIDAVSGATVTSNGLLEAAADALNQAGADILALRAVPVNREVVVSKDMTTQVVVAGSGISGMMAAVTAANGLYQADE